MHASVSKPWPTPQNTGPRSEPTRTRNSSVTSSSHGQIIENLTINGRLTIRHNNVTVRDVVVNGRGTYMIQVVETASGRCPENVRIVYTEVNGANAAENDIPLYSPDCGYTFDHGYIHNVGRTSRLVNNTTISNSYIFSNRTGDSDAHRGAVGTNGGSNNQIIHNVLMCSGRGCSAAIPMYGDFDPVNGLLVRHNLLATTGSYCAYGGSLSSKPYPNGSNIRFIDNHFSTRFHDSCGRYGAISGFDNGERGNVWSGNIWHESGRPVSAGGGGDSGSVTVNGNYTVSSSRTIPGNLTVRNGTVTIHGTVRGNVTHTGSGWVNVGSSGHVQGNVVDSGSGGVQISGDVDGSVTESGRGNVEVTYRGDVDGSITERDSGNLIIRSTVGRVAEGGDGYLMLGRNARVSGSATEWDVGRLYVYRGARVSGSVTENGVGSRINR